MLRLVATSVVLTLLSAPTWAGEPAAPAFEKDLHKAFAASRESGKPVLLYVHDSV